MDQKPYVCKNIVIDLESYQAIQDLIKERGFGGNNPVSQVKGYSIAVRTIIREWLAMKVQ